MSGAAAQRGAAVARGKSCTAPFTQTYGMVREDISMTGPGPLTQQEHDPQAI